MPPQIAVSSYSLRQCLGPLKLMMRGPDGTKQPFVWDLPQTITLLEFPGLVRKKLGLSMVEICQFHIPERTPAYVAQLKQALAQAEVQLLNMPIDVGNISDANAEFREEDLNEIEAWMHIAAELGAHMVRVNASAPMSGAALAPIDVTIVSYQRLAKTAQKLGLQLLVENHGGITTDPEVVVQLVESVAGLKVLADIGNFEPLISAQMARMQGQEVQINDYSSAYTGIARIAPYAGLVHAKTHDFDAHGEPVGLDVRRSLGIIHATGYQGPFSLEYEGDNGDPWQHTRRTHELVEEVFA
jgi:sugar phosphate isomerase/epimerase